MTFLEKAKEEIAKLRLSTSGIPLICPSHLGLEDEGCPPKMSCEMCWNREMPNTETKAEILKEVHEHFGTEEADIGYVEGLEHGRNEVWELIKKLFEMENDKFREAFPPHTYVSSVMNTYTPQEALAKLKAYEEAQSKVVVGDVVYHDAYGNGIMTREDEDYYNVLLENGDSMCFEKGSVAKTGKHIDIADLLKQIGE